MDLERNLFFTALVGYGLSTILYLAYIIFPRIIPKWLPTTVLLLTSLLNISVVLLRAVETGRSPWQSRYESITLFGMIIGVIYLVTEWRLRIKLGGVIASFIAFMLFVYIVVIGLYHEGVPISWANILYMVENGGPQMDPAPLFPALQSNWFFFHVLLAFHGYAFFTIGFTLEVASALLNLKALRGFREATGITENGMHRLSRFTYNMVLFAFPLQTWTLCSGAAWADKAWGVYWGWDPKEIWALITWLIYASYLHLKGHPNWRGRPASIVNVIGFTSVITAYLMVDFLVKWFKLYSLHAFG